MDAAILVVGAGPTGLLLANLLGARGIETLVVERNRDGVRQSRAIGITPPSLEILRTVDLADGFVGAGVAVDHAIVHGTRGALGRVVFDRVHPRFAFILSVPQRTTVELLREGAERYPSLRIDYGADVTGILEDPQGVTARCGDGRTLRARYVVAADGARSTLAEAAGIARRRVIYRPRFFMADFVDRGALGNAAHLWFTRSGAVESFPLPGGVRRWIVQLPDGVDLPEPPGDFDLEGAVERRANVRLSYHDRLWQSAFQPERSEITQFSRGRVFFAGDAAHTMSPIGGQGMNTGFADAELLSLTLDFLLHGEAARLPGAAASRAPTPRLYQRARRTASRSAARRAWAGMSIGTMRGRVASTLRDAIVALLLLGPNRAIARHFAMQTIPLRRAALALRHRRLFKPGDAHEAGDKIA